MRKGKAPTFLWDWKTEPKELRLLRDGEHVATVTRWASDKDPDKTAWWAAETVPGQSPIGGAIHDTLALACISVIVYFRSEIEPPQQLLDEWDERGPLPVDAKQASIAKPTATGKSQEMIAIYWEWVEGTPHFGARFWGCHSIETDGRVRDWPKHGLRPIGAAKVTVTEGQGLHLLASMTNDVRRERNA